MKIWTKLAPCITFRELSTASAAAEEGAEQARSGRLGSDRLGQWRENLFHSHLRLRPLINHGTVKAARLFIRRFSPGRASDRGRGKNAPVCIVIPGAAAARKNLLGGASERGCQIHHRKRTLLDEDDDDGAETDAEREWGKKYCFGQGDEWLQSNLTPSAFFACRHLLIEGSKLASNSCVYLRCIQCHVN